MEKINFDMPGDDAVILQLLDGTHYCLAFKIPAELLARIALVGGDEAFNCRVHQSLVLNHLLELGTAAKEAELEAEAGQEELF